MKKYALFLIFYFVSATAFAMGSRPEPPTFHPPDQPTIGPGSDDYIYSQVIHESFGIGATAYDIFGPDCIECPSDLPVIVFLHGWSFINPDIYNGWITHLARRGNIVIYPRYQLLFSLPSTFTNSATIGIKNAMQVLNEGSNFDFTPDWNRVAVVGHSLGGVIAANLAAKNDPDLPVFGAVMVVEAGGMRFVVSHDYSQIPGNTLLLCVVGEEDTNQTDGRFIFDNATAVGLENKDFITMVSDYYGTPPLVADHFVPVSDSDSSTDALDYFGLWKWFDGLYEAAFYEINREYALDDTPEQRYMGQWSDGTAVNEPLIE